MPRRLLLGWSLFAFTCGTLSAQTEPERPGNVRRSVSDTSDPAAELPSSFFQLPNYGEPAAPPKTEPPPPATEPVSPPKPVEMPPAETEPQPPQVSSRRVFQQQPAVLEPPPPATLPPLNPQPLAPPQFAQPPQFESAIAPASHTHPLPAEMKRELADQPLRLAPRSGEHDKAMERPAAVNAMPNAASIAGALAAVLGLFLLFAWCTRRSLPQGMSRLPTEALEVLGRMPVHGKQEFQLVRVGNKLVLLAVSPMGMESVAEVDDPIEVERICALCKRSAPGSITESFREVLGQLGGETTRGGFAGEFARAAPASVRERAGR